MLGILPACVELAIATATVLVGKELLDK